MKGVLGLILMMLLCAACFSKKFNVDSIISKLAVDEQNPCLVHVEENITLTFVEGSFTRFGRYLADSYVPDNNIQIVHVNATSQDFNVTSVRSERGKKNEGSFIVVKFTPESERSGNILLTYSINNLFASNVVNNRNEFAFGYKFNAPISTAVITFELPTTDPPIQQEEISTSHDLKYNDVATKLAGTVTFSVANISAYDTYTATIEIPLKYSQCKPHVLSTLTTYIPSFVLGMLILLAFIFRNPRRTPAVKAESDPDVSSDDYDDYSDSSEDDSE